MVANIPVLPAPAGMIPAGSGPTRREGRSPHPRGRSSPWTRLPFERGAPRTHGDGSWGLPVRIGARGCSPHPRGWSFLAAHVGGDAEVLPAPAGMVPGHGSLRSFVFAAPRMRRGAPQRRSVRRNPELLLRVHAGMFPSARCQLHAPSSSCMRGWPRALGSAQRGDELLPAPAGMGPTTAGSTAAAPKAPRACGDGPMPPRRDVPVARCSPTRG